MEGDVRLRWEGGERTRRKRGEKDNVSGGASGQLYRYEKHRGLDGQAVASTLAVIPK